MISAIVLAAGLARRFGSAKPLAIYNRKPLVRHVVQILNAGGVQDVVVVVPPAARFYQKALARTGARLILNERPEEGLSSSLRLGLAALDANTAAVIVALADQPTIESSVVDLLIHEWQRTQAAIVAPLYRGERGNPVLFDVTVFPELRSLTGDRGAREVIERDPSRVCLVALDRDFPPDVDTQDDLVALRRQRAKRR